VLLRFLINDRAEGHFLVEEVLPHLVGHQRQLPRRLGHGRERRRRRFLHAFDRRLHAAGNLLRDRLRGLEVLGQLVVPAARCTIRLESGLLAAGRAGHALLDHLHRHADPAERQRRSEGPARVLLAHPAELPPRHRFHLAPQLRTIEVVEKPLLVRPMGLQLRHRCDPPASIHLFAMQKPH
jgi:hypothetical protein